MEKYFINQYLFSEIYLEEITQLVEDRSLLATFQTFTENRLYAERFNLKVWNDTFVHELLRSLKFKVDKVTENLSVLKEYGSDDKALSVCYSLLPEKDLDNTLMGSNYAYEIIAALKKNDLQWGILTNGEKWRIYHTEESTPYENYLEIDLKAILDNQVKQAFQLIFFFLKAENFIRDAKGNCKFDLFKKESLDKIAYIEDELKNALKEKDEGGEDILSNICYGYVQYLRRQGNTDFSSESLRDEIYGGALLFMFRLLFLLYAQARDLMTQDDTEDFQGLLDKAKKSYLNGFATSDSKELWVHLRNLFGVIDNTYNGGLFNREENLYTRFIEDAWISDELLSGVIYNLSHYQEKDGKIKPISYRDMNVKHLGTLYEGLLEHKLFIAEEDIEIQVSKKEVKFIPESEGGKIIKGKYIPKGEVYFGNDKGLRKATGSYYTPEYIVEYIVTNTVDEKLKEFRVKFDEQITEYLQDLKLAINEVERKRIEGLIKEQLIVFVNKEVLELSVLDPAMGSGHFLVNATSHIANFITEFLNSYVIKGDIETGSKYWSRIVVENCIYGVDLNILATELAKLSLWILNMAKDKPLSFLNHHLKIGNSLIGTKLSELGNYPFSGLRQQRDLFTQNEDFRFVVKKVINDYSLIRKEASETRQNIESKKEYLDEIDKLIRPFKDLCNVHTGLFFDLTLDEKEYNDYIKNRIIPNEKPIMKYFHWELEFPDILLKRKGFNIVIGNPPWGANLSQGEKNFIKRYFKTAEAKDGLEGSLNPFSIFIEKGADLTHWSSSILSYIVPLSFGTTKSMESTHSKLTNDFNSLKVLFFSERPGRVFPMVEQPVCIFLCERSTPSTGLKYFATEFIKFQTGELPNLLRHLELQEVPNQYIILGKLPKIGNEISLSILQKINQKSSPISSYFNFYQTDKLNHRIYYKNAGGRYFKPFTTFFNGITVNGVERSSTTQGVLYLEDKKYLQPINAILNSTLFFWIYQVYSDCWHLNPDDFNYLKIDISDFNPQVLEKLTLLNEKLMENLLDNSLEKINEKGTNTIKYFELYARKGKHILDVIDSILFEIYELNEVEKEYIVNYR